MLYENIMRYLLLIRNAKIQLFSNYKQIQKKFFKSTDYMAYAILSTNTVTIKK